MSRRRKLLLGIVLLVVVLMIGTVSLAAATAIGQGVIRIRVDSGGLDRDTLDAGCAAVGLNGTQAATCEFPSGSILPCYQEQQAASGRTSEGEANRVSPAD